ncbi:MAG: hypothetical protein IKB97_01540 [Bacteroidaceae bacterium]|nr:hypothetical protein [Bacteroidaceae bacterium]
MAALHSVEFCQQMVSEYQHALSKVLLGQSYSINGRALTRVNHNEILEGLKYWNDELAKAKAAEGGDIGTIRCRRVIIHG